MVRYRLLVSRDAVRFAELLADINPAGAILVSSKPDGDAVYDVRNLVIATHLPVLAHDQLRNALVDEPIYRSWPPARPRWRSAWSSPSCTCNSTLNRSSAMSGGNGRFRSGRCAMLMP
jgi:hypothetical protein